MKAFLERTAEHLVKSYGDETGELCIVLPNRRAGLFLKEYLAASSGKISWAPDVYSIEDLIQKLSGLQKVDNITLLFELYEVYRTAKGEAAEPFDEFSKWAQVFIQDINEIDRYLVDAEQLFGNLENIKEIENWSLLREDLTEFQQNYLDFFRSLGPLYFQLKERLLSKKQTYEGLAFRLVHEQLDERLKLQSWKKIIFAGFNAMNEAEERILTKLIAQNKAEVLWDSDAYYMEQPVQEAGKFLRRLIPKFKGENNKEIFWEENLLSTDEKKIHVIGAAKNIAQASVAAGILEKINVPGTKLRNTALVLADENLLFPVLHAIPSEIEAINVTMGYPLKNTPFAGLVEILFNLHEYSKRFSKERASDTARFYHKEVLKLLSHPYIKFLFPGSTIINKMKRGILERNYIFISLKELEKLIDETQKNEFETFSELLRPWNSSNDALLSLEQLIQLLRAQFMKEKERSTTETEYIFAFSKILKRVRSLMEDHKHDFTLKTLHSLVKQITSASTLPFYGEPLTGLQVMGVLETRTLDFENVIMLSVNENVLPSAKHQQTFIPFDLKKAFGLPTYSDKDAVFAYHFYRLLQRAKNIYLLYNTETDEFGKGERSRFITQLLYELPLKNPNLTIEEKLVVTENISPLKEAITIPKDPNVLLQLDEKAKKGISPSALNTFKNCSLQFYFRHIAGLKEKEEVEETIAADTLGTAIHETLEELYKPFVKKVLKASDVEEMKGRVEQLTENEFLKLYSSHELRYGKNLLTLRIAVKFIMTFLDTEISFINKLEKENKYLSILELEKQLEHTVMVNNKPVLIHGNADRIDSIGGTTRIIDYKTGRAEDKELHFEDWADIIQDPLLNKSFQLLIYGALYRAAGNAAAIVRSGIISFRELSAGLKTVSVNGSDVLDNATLDRFEQELVLLLENVFNPEQPFVQTNDLDICRFCPYKTICNR